MSLSLLILRSHPSTVHFLFSREVIYETKDGSKLSDRTGGVKSSFQLWSDVFFLSFFHSFNWDLTMLLCDFVGDTHIQFFGVKASGSRARGFQTAVNHSVHMMNLYLNGIHFPIMSELFLRFDVLLTCWPSNSTPDWTAIFIKTNSLWKRVE